MRGENWLLPGYEHITGRHADFSPGSADLPLIAETVASLHRPAPEGTRSFAERLRAISAWARLRADPPADLLEWQRERLDLFAEMEREAIKEVDGDALVHSDLHPLNFLISSKVHVIDWAWACRAAPWVDHELLALRLVIAGREPTPTERTAFAVSICGLWEYRSRRNPAPHWDALLRGARSWARRSVGLV
ncbi:phosphotransferase [Allokutzneria sp. A3M-2-11 16]|uniref:phosphotransferase family protein n=1 Tax=Allokutzneria sp. A3M-2-11 16 TaxID=2962043 RepID=UPI0020B7CA95|nr:phosphotransferase [Allokutzneria sp. A3M-2-11 16]MCP3804005.1 phosphotransferase [Allokutzneria sp. A3M-2-11 16]